MKGKPSGKNNKKNYDATHTPDGVIVTEPEYSCAQIDKEIFWLTN